MRECRATSLGLVERGKSLRKDGDRSFVLTRSFFAGSQRWGPLWTGDNVASWDALRVSVPMVLALNLAGFPWAGTARLEPAVQLRQHPIMHHLIGIMAYSAGSQNFKKVEERATPDRAMLIDRVEMSR